MSLDENIALAEGQSKPTVCAHVVKHTLPSSGETFKAFHLALGLCLNDYTFKKGKGKKKEKTKITLGYKILN